MPDEKAASADWLLRVVIHRPMGRLDQRVVDGKNYHYPTARIPAGRAPGGDTSRLCIPLTLPWGRRSRRSKRLQIQPFRIEQYYERYEFDVELMFSSSDCETRTIGELLALEPGAADRLLGYRCGYTEVRGASYLREAIAHLYETISADEVLVLSSAEEAIFTLYHALLGPEDHCVIQTPCYESAIGVPRSTGCRLSTWQARFEDAWAYDLNALEQAMRPHTSLLYINSPHNPTGKHMTQSTFADVVAVAAASGAVLFSDEVYRGLEHEPRLQLPAACDAYERGVSLGSVSKSYGLPGLRIGWIATHDKALLCQVADLKLYTTICSSGPSEFLTALALRHSDSLLARNLKLVRSNLNLVDDLISKHPDFLTWVRPVAGPVGFPKVRGDAPDANDLCDEVRQRYGVLLLPGGVFDHPEHVRIGFGRKDTPLALQRFDRYLTAKRENEDEYVPQVQARRNL